MTCGRHRGSLPSILLRSVFSRSGFSCARRLRSSLVQMMKALRGLRTRTCAEEDLASGLVQLESELTDRGLDGAEPGERVCSPSAEPQSSISIAETFEARSWKRAESWPRRMAVQGRWR